ncbi:MAG: outer membrane beta-barrel protein [Saprospiraceae bacterium]|nr:outer membrane beta-barrel protein [Candidatus Defluviibacterium haderslevense]
MKKQCLFLSLFVLSLLSTSTFAQDHKMWIGVDLGFNSHKVGDADNTSSFKIKPTFGYHINEAMAVGIKVGYESEAKDVSSFEVNPFFRYGKSIGDKATLFGELGVDITSGSDKRTSTEVKTNSFDVGISPGVTYMFADNWGLEAHFGKLGFKSEGGSIGDVDSDKTTNFGIDLTMSSLSFGLTYHF